MSPDPLLDRLAAGPQPGYTGGTCAAVLHPRAGVRRPAPVDPAERFVVRGPDGPRSYRPAVPTVVLPEGAGWSFEAGPGVLRVGLRSPPPADDPSGFVGLLHDPGNLFADRLRTRPWVPEGSARPFTAARPGELPTTAALAGHRCAEPRGLVWLRAADVLGGRPDPCRWFAVEWPEADAEEAARDLRARARPNGTLLTDRLVSTVSSELLASDGPGRFTIPAGDDLPAEQGVTVLSVAHRGRRLRGATDLGDWDAAVFRVEDMTRFPGLLARVHCPGQVANPLIEIVRFPRTRPAESDRSPVWADAALEEGGLAAAEVVGRVADPVPPPHGLHRAEALRRALGHYPRYDLARLLAGPPECGEAVLWPAAGGLRAVLPVAVRVRPDPRLSRRDFADLAADLSRHLVNHLAGPLHFRCSVEEVGHAG